MSDPSDFTVKVRGDRDLIISKPEEGFEVTYRREVYYPMLIASDVLRNDFDESKVRLLAQAWKLALSKAKSLGAGRPKTKARTRAEESTPTCLIGPRSTQKFLNVGLKHAE